jgi:hypothetical protein
MSFRAIASVASIVLVPLVSAAVAQQAGTATNNAAASASSALTNPPVFQGLMVNAKGKTVGRYVFFGLYGGGALGPFNTFVIRQISGIWVMIPVGDFKTGFLPVYDPSAIQYYYQSADCTGVLYLQVNSDPSNSYATAPALGQVATVPPATAPSIYFAGAPALVTFQSRLLLSQTCRPYAPGGYTNYAGPAQNVPVSSLGLTLPFSIK